MCFRRRRPNGVMRDASNATRQDSVKMPDGGEQPCGASLRSAQTGPVAVSKADLISTGWISRKPIVVGNPTPRFEPKQVSVEYRRQPYRPDTVLDGWSSGEFSVRGGSIRGYMHRYDGAPRQDDFVVAARSGGRQIIAAVADGVSQATQSHIGSTAAVRYAAQWLDSMLGDPIEATDWNSLIESTAWTLIEQARAIDPECTDAVLAEQMLATTLTCAVVEVADDGEVVAHIINVGDSGAWLLSNAGYRRVEGGKAEADSGISSSAVSGLPRVPCDIHPTRVVLHDDDVLLLGTDGFGDPLGGGEGLVGKLFAEVLLSGPPTLTEFGHALDFSRETFDDDRTLVAIWHQTQKGTGS
jgi:hypothetical protein